MPRNAADTEDPRLVKALAHPIRLRIMELLDGQTKTPKQLAADLDLPLENGSYHVRTLKQFGFIKLEETRQVRGAVEHHYAAATHPRVATSPYVVDEEGFAEISGILDEAIQRVEDAAAASRKRMGRGKGIKATAVVMLFGMK